MSDQEFQISLDSKLLIKAVGVMSCFKACTVSPMWIVSGPREELDYETP